MNRKVCPVSFNLDEHYEKRLYDHATKKVFSKYIKRLIDKDLEKEIPITNKSNEDGYLTN